MRTIGLGRVAAGPLCLLATLLVVGSLVAATSSARASRQHLSASSPLIAAAGGQSGAAFTVERRDRFPSLVDQGGPARYCGETEIPETNDGSAMEVDVFGRRAPRCRFARRKLRRVPRRARNSAGSASVGGTASGRLRPSSASVVERLCGRPIRAIERCAEPLLAWSGDQHRLFAPEAGLARR